MRALLLVSLLAACTTTTIEPDAGVDAIGTVVYPCNIQHERCAAARDAAEVICDWKMRCDPLVDDRLACVASEMYSLCSGGAACNVSPYDRSELDACLAEQADATCEGGIDCEL